jgi:transglutaminase-like putative cysteine protease
MLAPGQILQLVESEEVAFRVRLSAALPPSQLYWRGAVLWDTDGFVWHNRVPPSDEVMVPGPSSQKTVTQEITLEPHLKGVLFGLDVPTAAEILTPSYQTVRRGDGPTLLAGQKIYERTRYRVQSRLAAPLTSLTPVERSRALALPSLTDARILKLVDAWRTAVRRSPSGVVDLALEHFRKNFFYTLTPGSILTLEEFLFAARRGFCGHFASAFTVLMRHAGIPARVVLGYQGGTHNILGDYWIVRQQHAHAWSEVWLEGQGWMRVDPTAAVMPARLESGLALQELEAGFLTDLKRRIRLAWDAARYLWQDGVVAEQAEWWRSFLGEKAAGQRYERYVWLLLLLCALLLASLLIITLPRLGARLARRPQDLAVRYYSRLCRRLARKGLPRQGPEGPVDYCRRLSPQLMPVTRAEVARATDLFVGLHYGIPPAVRRDLTELRRSCGVKIVRR